MQQKNGSPGGRVYIGNYNTPTERLQKCSLSFYLHSGVTEGCIMDEKLFEVFTEFTNVLKETSINQREGSNNQTKQALTFSKNMVKAFIVMAVALLLTNIITASCLIYNLYQQYNYSGYPDTQIENTNVGGDYNGEDSKTTEETKTTEAPIKE